MTALIPVTLQAPGFLGLNTQDSAIGIDFQWGLVADNCVFDDTGRISARKGFNKITSSAVTGDIEQVFEYKESATSKRIISSANAKLYEGTTTLTEKQGSLTPTNNDWKFLDFKNKCLAWQAGEEPITKTGSGNFTTIQAGHTDWQASTAYAVHDCVKATSSANPTMYFVCTTAGTTAGSEPTWTTTDLGSTTDNTAVWKTVIIPQGNEALSAYGRVWAVTENKTGIKYSALLDETKFDSGNGGGDIDMLAVWVGGSDTIEALAAFNDRLIIFGKGSIVIYASPNAPTNLAIEDIIGGIGCTARDSVQDVGTDLLFLSQDGVRSFSRTVLQETLPLQDISKKVKDELVSLAASSIATVQSVYSPDEGFYLLRTGMFTWCLDLKKPSQESFARVTRWNGIPIKSMTYASDGTLYFGGVGMIGSYSGYNDIAASYIMAYKSPWVDFSSKDPAVSTRLKIPKKLRATIYGGFAYSITFLYAFDFNSPTTFSVSTPVGTTAATEYGIGEYGIGEYSGGAQAIAQVAAGLGKSGQHLQFGYSVTINGNPIAFQKIDLLMKLGRSIN